MCVNVLSGSVVCVVCIMSSGRNYSEVCVTCEGNIKRYIYYVVVMAPRKKVIETFSLNRCVQLYAMFSLFGILCFGYLQ